MTFTYTNSRQHELDCIKNAFERIDGFSLIIKLECAENICEQNVFDCNDFEGENR